MLIQDVVIKTSIAIAVGGLIGFEREKKRKPAGFTTHTLVCVGACVVAMIQVLITESTYERAYLSPELLPMLGADPARLIAQVVSGIGFLGAGTIIQTRDVVTGITTAATLWLVACLGIGIGMGYYKMILIVFGMVIVSLFIMKRIQLSLLERRKIRKVTILFNKNSNIENFLDNIFKKKNIKIANIKYIDERITEESSKSKIVYTLLVPKHIKSQDLINEISRETSIKKISIM